MKARVLAVLLPHEDCGPLCPYCPPPGGVRSPADLQRLDRAVEQQLDSAETRARLPGQGTLELGCFGGDLLARSAARRDGLVAAAATWLRKGWIAGFRYTTQPERCVRWGGRAQRALGVTTVELPVHSFDVRVRRAFGLNSAPPVEAAAEELRAAGLRWILHLTPGLPGSHAEEAETSARAAARLRPDGVRIHPALALAGTRLAGPWLSGRWAPPDLPQCLELVDRAVAIFTEASIPVVRVGLQPGTDLFGSPSVLAGTVDPALRARAAGPRLRHAALCAAVALDRRGARALCFRVHPADEGALRGPENQQLREVGELLGLVDLVVRPDPRLARGEVRAERTEPRPFAVARAS